MIRTLILLLALGTVSLSKAQVSEEINPNIDKEWRFVRGGDVALPNGIPYSFEIPAEVGYDYMFTLKSDQDTMDVQVTITSMQGQVIKSVVNEAVSGDFTFSFEVKANATYQVVIGVVDASKAGGSMLGTEMFLVRRVHH